MYAFVGVIGDNACLEVEYLHQIILYSVLLKCSTNTLAMLLSFAQPVYQSIQNCTPSPSMHANLMCSWHLVYRRGQPARRQLFQPQLLVKAAVPNGEKTSDDNARPKLTFYAMHAYSTYFKVTTSS